MGAYYDLERAIEEAALPPELVQEILEDVRAEFLDDEMMYELHVIRALDDEMMYELHVIRALDAEVTLQMSSEERLQRVAARAARFLAEGNMELRAISPETVPRIVRSAKKP